MNNKLSTNDELFNSFLVWATNADSWNDQYASVWARGSSLDEWDIQVLPTQDPYHLLPLCVQSTPKDSAQEYMMMMYGWATPVTEDNEEVEGEERRRIRVIVYFHKGEERIALQFKGETIEEVPNGEGMFGDAIRELRAIQSANN